MKKTVILTSLLIITACFTGCSARFDAAKFVEDSIDSRCFGVSGPDMPGRTAKSEDEIRNSYEAGVQAEAEFFRAFFDINENLIPAAVNDDITEMFERILSEADCEIGEAIKSENGYLVSVTVYPLDIIRKVITEDIGDFTDCWQTRSDAGEFGGMSDEEFETLWASDIIGLVYARIAGIGRLEPETVSVRVIRESSGGGIYYATDENDLNQLARLIIPYR